MLTTGFFAAVGLAAILLWKQGILHEAYYWTMAGDDVAHVFWQKGILNTLFFVGACLPLIIGAVMACQAKYNIWPGRTAERTALLGLLAASAILRCGRRPLLPALLCPTHSSVSIARSPVLRRPLVPANTAAPLATAT